MTAPTHEALVTLARQVFKDEGIAVPPDAAPGDIRLIGSHAVCESVGLVGFLVAYEERLHRELGLTVSLMDDRAMSQTRSPFRSLATLVEFALSATDSPKS